MVGEATAVMLAMLVGAWGWPSEMTVTTATEVGTWGWPSEMAVAVAMGVVTGATTAALLEVEVVMVDMTITELELVDGAGVMAAGVEEMVRVMPADAQKDTAKARALARSDALQAAATAGSSEVRKDWSLQIQAVSVSAQPVEPRAEMAGVSWTLRVSDSAWES